MKNKLVWRLSKLPTPSELQGLVNDKIITQDEAREILFETQTEEKIEAEELKAEIKFLRKVIDSLSGDKIKVIEKEIHHYKKWGWYEPYYTWVNTPSWTYTVSGTTGITGSDSLTNITGSSATTTLGSLSLSDIKTF